MGDGEIIWVFLYEGFSVRESFLLLGNGNFGEESVLGLWEVPVSIHYEAVIFWGDLFWGYGGRTAIPGRPPPKQTGQRSGELTANCG